MKRAVAVAVVLTGCAAETGQNVDTSAEASTVVPGDLTYELRSFEFTERHTPNPCGPIPGFYGAATQICDRLAFQSSTEVRCDDLASGTYLKWMMLRPANDNGVGWGLLEVVNDNCDSEYDVTHSPQEVP